GDERSPRLRSHLGAFRIRWVAAIPGALGRRSWLHLRGHGGQPARRAELDSLGSRVRQLRHGRFLRDSDADRSAQPRTLCSVVADGLAVLACPRPRAYRAARALGLRRAGTYDLQAVRAGALSAPSLPVCSRAAGARWRALGASLGLRPFGGPYDLAH